MAPTAGKLVSERFAHDGGRTVTAYVPAAGPPEAVVYAADGGWHLERLVAALEADAAAPVTMIVGVHGMDTDEGRFGEYVPGVDDARFAAHEAFFVDEVRAWIAATFDGAPGAHTAVWGASLGGELALAMGVRHPDVYRSVFSASPGGGFRPTEPLPADLPALYLVAGEQEPFFAENAKRWSDAAQEAGHDAVVHLRPGDHGGDFWFEELPRMVTWALRR